MYQEERLIVIVQHMKRHQRISVENICELFGVSRDTARRDIVKLEEQGAILRTRGGAILPTLSKDVSSFQQRMQDETASKQAIGRAAAALIQDRDYLLLDASTTVKKAAEFLTAKKIVAVTNSIEIAGTLIGKEDATVHLLGGHLHPEHRFLYGPRTLEMLADYRVDKLLLGACAITEDGIFNPFEDETYVIRSMMKRADQIILLADHSKFGKRQFHRVASIADVDILVTDREPDDSMRELLHNHQVHIIVAGEEPSL